MPAMEDLTEAFNSMASAVRENTAAILGQNARPAAPAAAGKPNGTVAAGKPKATLDMVMKACVQVKDDIGEDEAKAIIKDVGKSAKLKDIAPKYFDAVMAACKTAIEAHSAGGDSDPDDDGEL